MTIPTSSASQSGEAVQASSAQDEPNYKALYTELKGEAVKAQRALAYIVGVAEEGYRGHAIIDLDPGEWSDLQSALSSLHEKLSSIGGSPSTESAASLADGKLTAGEAQRKSEGGAA